MLGCIVSRLCRSSLWGVNQLSLQSEGGGQSAELPGRAENLKNCSCCCHGSVLLWGGFICLWFLYVFSMHWYFLIFSYKLTVSNGLSLATLKSVEFT